MGKEKSPTLGAFEAEWFDRRCDHWSTHTRGGYHSLIQNHITPGLGGAALAKLTTQQIETFYNTLPQKGLGRQTIWCVHLLLRRILDEACRCGLIENNPATHCKLPQCATSNRIPLRRGQLERYLTAAEALGALPLLYMGLTVGLRQCELFTLLWADFDVEAVALHKGKRLLSLKERAIALLTQELERHPGRPEIFLNPKTDAPTACMNSTTCTSRCWRWQDCHG